MGNSLTKGYALEAERPPPRRRRSRRSTNYTYSPPPRKDRTWSPSQHTRHTASGTDDERPHRSRRRTSALAETDGNARSATGKARHIGHKKRDHEPRAARAPSRERRASPHIHRTRQAERQRPSRRTSSPPNSRVSRTKAGRDPRSRGSRHESSLQKGKAPVYVETIELEERGPRKECMICTENRPVHRFPSRPPTDQCTHEISTCRRCLRKWIQSSLQTKLWDQITCPECGVRLGHADVRASASSAIFQRYDELATRAALESIQGFRWCIAKGCKSGQVHEQGTAMPRFRCLACDASHCVVHGVPWHQGETCAEYDYRTDGKQKKAEEAASRKWIKEMAKACPKCKRNIQKASGCDHMTCSKCRHEFCWRCLAPYDAIRDRGQGMHRKDCVYYEDWRNSRA